MRSIFILRKILERDKLSIENAMRTIWQMKMEINKKILDGIKNDKGIVLPERQNDRVFDITTIINKAVESHDSLEIVEDKLYYIVDVKSTIRQTGETFLPTVGDMNRLNSYSRSDSKQDYERLNRIIEFYEMNRYKMMLLGYWFDQSRGVNFGTGWLVTENKIMIPIIRNENDFTSPRYGLPVGTFPESNWYISYYWTNWGQAEDFFETNHIKQMVTYYSENMMEYETFETISKERFRLLASKANRWRMGINHRLDMWFPMPSDNVELYEYMRLWTKWLNQIKKKRNEIGRTLNGGIINLIEEGKSKVASFDQADLEKIGKNMDMHLVRRTWGIELEVYDAKNVRASDINDSVLTSCSDSSITSGDYDDCECDCSDCTYHECDCEHCESYNDSPDHCGDSYCVSGDPLEFKTRKGQWTSKVPAVTALYNKLNEEKAEVNDSCGLHCHVYALDLNANQMGHAMGAYAMIAPKFNRALGRYNTNYAAAIEPGRVKALMKGEAEIGGSRNEFNLHALQKFGTIEFRQAEATLNLELTYGWAWICRGIITAAKEGAKVTEYKDITNVQQLIDLFAKYGHTIKDELNGRDHVYGTVRDNVHYRKELTSWR